MASAVKVTTIGGSVGILLPDEVLERLQVRCGDTLYLTETPEGIRLTASRPDFAQAIEAGQRVMQKYQNALRKLRF